MVLHTLAAAPGHPAFTDCLALAQDGDAVLLLGDGVYGALAGTASREALLASGAGIYLLDQDARGAGVPLAQDGIELVDMDGFAALTERYARQLAWY